MSVQKENMMFGTGELYIDDFRLGNFKDVTFLYTKEFAEAKPPNFTSIVRRDLYRESVVMTGTLADVDSNRLATLMGLTMSTTQLTGTTTLRVSQEVQLASTSATWKTLAEAAVSLTNIVVKTLDNQTSLADGTDVSITTTVGQHTKIKPVSASYKSAYVLVTYDYADVSALRIKVGGKTTHEEKKLKFVHTLSTGKRLQITIPKVQMTSELSLPFKEEDYVTVPISFTAVGDTTAAKGTQLFTIVRER